MKKRSWILSGILGADYWHIDPSTDLLPPHNLFQNFETKKKNDWFIDLSLITEVLFLLH
jgi:hypothetical protein